jgi:hypothetical protein
LTPLKSFQRGIPLRRHRCRNRRRGPEKRMDKARYRSRSILDGHIVPNRELTDRGTLPIGRHPLLRLTGHRRRNRPEAFGGCTEIQTVTRSFERERNADAYRCLSTSSFLKSCRA